MLTGDDEKRTQGKVRREIIPQIILKSPLLFGDFQLSHGRHDISKLHVIPRGDTMLISEPPLCFRSLQRGGFTIASTRASFIIITEHTKRFFTWISLSPHLTSLTRSQSQSHGPEEGATHPTSARLTI